MHHHRKQSLDTSTIIRRPAALALLATATTGIACIQPAVVKAVKSPRDGRPLNNSICIVYSDRYQIRLGGLERLHPFDINKYAKIYRQLVADGLIEPADVYVPRPISREDLLRVHTPGYLARLRNSFALAGYLESAPLAAVPAFITDPAILEPFRHATGGTLLAARLALKHGAAINLGGGYHHAEPDRGGGFCIYADMPIAIRVLQAEGLIDRALVVDLDVHQGNGTALCVAADERIFTFDMHQRWIYPEPKETNDLDVALSAGTGDEDFLRHLRKYLPRVFDAAAASEPACPHAGLAERAPGSGQSRLDLVIYQAGVDGLAGDPLAGWRLSPAGIIERDALVFAEAWRRGVPIVMTLGGGYSERAWEVQNASIRGLLANSGTDEGAAPPHPRKR